MTYAYMPGNKQVDADVWIPKGQHVAGNAIGIVAMTCWYPLFPGNVANASTYNFPVLYKILEGTGVEQVSRADETLGDKIIVGGKELEQQGVRAIVGACGYFGNYQERTAAALDVPVFLSSLLQIPIISRSLKPHQKVGVLCGSYSALTPYILNQCGVDDLSKIVAYGTEGLPTIQSIPQNTGHFNSGIVEQEVVSLAKKMMDENPDVGAILLECSDMPPYAWAIQNAAQVPVFDFITMINWIYDAVVRRPFAGFM
jgi:hypothetical protein